MMPSERCLELVLADNMVGWQHDMVVIPPELGGTTQLLGCKPGFIVVGALSGGELELGFNCANPGVCVERVLCLLEQRGLHPQEVLIASNMRLLLSPSPMGLLLLSLHEVPQQLGLSC